MKQRHGRVYRPTAIVQEGKDDEGLTMEIKIDDNVPIPDRKTKAFGRTVRQLDIGQSFVWPDVHIRTQIAQIGARTGRTFCSRLELSGGLRVWRID